MEDSNPAVEMMEWLEESCSVRQWEIAQYSRGFVITEAVALDPSEVPKGWEITMITGSKVHIKHQ